MQPNFPEISVVIPALNEEGNIGPLIERLWATMKEIGLTAEILVIDGGSGDNTWKIAEERGARCILQRRLGYAGALREGFFEARGEYVLTMDSDLSHPPELLKDIWAVRHQADVIIASRFSIGGKSDAPFIRYLLSKILNQIFSTVLTLPVKDLSSGYRLYRRSAINRDAYHPENFSILQEVLVRSYTEGYSIKEVPLHYEERASGSSHVSLVNFAVSYLPTLYRLWKLRNSVESADYEYRAWFSRHPLQRYWIRKRIKLIKEFIGKPRKIIDIGSGSNYFAATTPGLVALDVEPRKIRFLSRTEAVPTLGNAEALPYDDKNFDQVVMSQVLSYVEDIDRALSQARRVLKDDGVLVICVPDSRRIGWRIIGALYRRLPNIRAANSKVKNHFSRSMLVDTLAQSGFRALEYRYICASELVIKCQKAA